MLYIEDLDPERHFIHIKDESISNSGCVAMLNGQLLDAGGRPRFYLAGKDWAKGWLSELNFSGDVAGQRRQYFVGARQKGYIGSNGSQSRFEFDYFRL
jgi:hypothetical protein